MSAYEYLCKDVMSDAVSEDKSEDYPVHPVNLNDIEEWFYTGDEVCEINSKKWYKYYCHIPLNGVVPPSAWSVKNNSGEVLT